MNKGRFHKPSFQYSAFHKNFMNQVMHQESNVFFCTDGDEREIITSAIIGIKIDFTLHRFEKQHECH